MLLLRLTAAMLCLSLSACFVWTDSGSYAKGEPGVVTFYNPSEMTAYLGGCTRFEKERWEAGQWAPAAPEISCLWEGYAQPVEAGVAISEPFSNASPGVWRLRYPTGWDCDPEAPLSDAHCAVLDDVVSNEFVVRGEGNDCVVSGCSGEVCGESSVATTCQYKPHYACFREAACERVGPEIDTTTGPVARCAWVPTRALRTCLAEYGVDS